MKTYDTGKAPCNDSESSEMPWLKCSMFPRASLSIVPVTNDNPLDTLLLVVSSGSGNSADVAGHKVFDFVGFSIGCIDGTDQHVVGDVVQMATVLEPRPSHYTAISTSIISTLTTTY